MVDAIQPGNYTIWNCIIHQSNVMYHVMHLGANVLNLYDLKCPGRIWSLSLGLKQFQYAEDQQFQLFWEDLIQRKLYSLIQYIPGLCFYMSQQDDCFIGSQATWSRRQATSRNPECLWFERMLQKKRILVSPYAKDIWELFQHVFDFCNVTSFGLWCHCRTQELVALSGAHTIGSKGFGDPTVFDNAYYKILLEKPWATTCKFHDKVLSFLYSTVSSSAHLYIVFFLWLHWRCS